MRRTGMRRKSGKRYVASAIVACNRKEDDEDVVEAFVALGTTWLTHVSFICQFYCRIGWIRSNILPSWCVLTGYQSRAHLERDARIPIAFLQASHILRRVIGKFQDNDHKSDSVGCPWPRRSSRRPEIVCFTFSSVPQLHHSTYS